MGWLPVLTLCLGCMGLGSMRKLDSSPGFRRILGVGGETMDRIGVERALDRIGGVSAWYEIA